MMPRCGMHALVEVLVPRQDDVDVPLDEDRLERRAQRTGAGLVAARRVERVMEEDDLPAAAGLLQPLLQPCELLGIERAAVEREEAHPGRRQARPGAGLARRNE